MHPAPGLLLNHSDACVFAPSKFKHRSPFFFLRVIIFIGASGIVMRSVFRFLFFSKDSDLYIIILLFVVFGLFTLGMISGEGLSGKATKTPGRSPEDICVLLLDSDPTCLTVISEMLQKSGYRVVTAERAADALHILREKDGEIDLIMAEAHLSDMGKYELLETITGISKVPIVVMAVDGQPNSALGCLYKGAKHYLVKPLVMGDLKNLWQVTISSRRGIRSQLDAGQLVQNGSGNNAQPPLHAEEHTKANKRMELAEMEEHKEANDDNCELGNHKKPNSFCADELQSGSVQGVRGLVNEDEVHRGKKRKERGGTEKLKEDELNLDNNKKKEEVETERHEEDGENSELGIQKQPKMVCADEMENRSSQIVGDVGADGLPVTVSNLHDGVLRSLEASMQSLGHQLSPEESSSNDHKWKQMLQPMPMRCTNPEQDGEEDNPAVEEPLNEEINVSEVSELILGNIRELAELLREDAEEEHDHPEEEGSSSDVLEKSPED